MLCIGGIANAADTSKLWQEDQITKCTKDCEHSISLRLPDSKVAETLFTEMHALVEELIKKDLVIRSTEAPILSDLQTALVESLVVAQKHGDFSIQTLRAGRAIVEEYREAPGIYRDLADRSPTRTNGIKLMRIEYELEQRCAK